MEASRACRWAKVYTLQRRLWRTAHCESILLDISLWSASNGNLIIFRKASWRFRWSACLTMSFLQCLKIVASIIKTLIDLINVSLFLLWMYAASRWLWETGDCWGKDSTTFIMIWAAYTVSFYMNVARRQSLLIELFKIKMRNSNCIGCWINCRCFPSLKMSCLDVFKH